MVLFFPGPGGHAADGEGVTGVRVEGRRHRRRSPLRGGFLLQLLVSILRGNLLNVSRQHAVPRDIEGQSVRTERESILSRSVKITCNSSHRPYTSSDVIEGIKTVIELDKIEAVSSHGRNTEYYVTLYSKDDVDALLSEEILVKSWPAVCGSLDRESFVVRVHWLPYWIDSSVITYNLGKHGKILKVFNETGATSDPDGRHIKTSIRRVVLQCRPGEKTKFPTSLPLKAVTFYSLLRVVPPFV